MELRDLEDGVTWLKQQPYVDSAHIIMSGWSYGGFMTTYALTHSTSWSAGIAGGPVTDWRDYDTIYTERYMGLLGDNLSGYEQSSAVENATKLDGHLLMIHSMMDDNVHPQNTMQLFTAFTNAGKDIEARIYPPGRHGAAYNGESARLIGEAQFDFLSRWLGKVPPREKIRP